MTEIVVVAEYPRKYRGQDLTVVRSRIKEILKKARLEIAETIKGRRDPRS